ncbi:MAG: hypothetical protein AWU57_1619 [Marinobacter sp. T13-3]|nr:MAG: hypothetical protein AWU57_1619 [Marinobacter sp. T13-3]
MNMLTLVAKRRMHRISRALGSLLCLYPRSDYRQHLYPHQRTAIEALCADQRRIVTYMPVSKASLKRKEEQ